MARVSVSLFIPGPPKSQKRHRTSFKNGRMWNYDPSKQEKVQFSLLAKKQASMLPLDAPISIKVICAFDRPKSHYGTGRNSGILKDNAPKYFTKKPDVDNCLKFVMDALQINKIWYPDDCVINDVTIQKIYADEITPGTYIELQSKLERKGIQDDPEC